MEFNLKTALILGSTLGAIGSAYVLFRKYREYRKHHLEFLDLVYDKNNRHLELFVVNQADKPVYVSPSLRLIHFLNPEEWRERKSNGNGNGNGASNGNSGSFNGVMSEGKCYQVDSVIKGYSLIGDCESHVKVEGRSVRKIVYPLPEHISLRVYDNIQVDSQYGFNGDLESRLVNTMRVMLKDDVDCAMFDGVLPGEVKPVYNPNLCSIPIPDISGNVVESDFPLQAMCVCCGKDRWLGWIVDGNHVCVECKDFLDGKPESMALPMVVSDPVSSDSGIFVDDIVLDQNHGSDLKSRHRDILSLLDHENNLTIKKISKILSLQESTIVSDLNFLMKKDLVGRIKVGNRYLYHLA